MPTYLVVAGEVYGSCRPISLLFGVRVYGLDGTAEANSILYLNLSMSRQQENIEHT